MGGRRTLQDEGLEGGALTRKKLPLLAALRKRRQQCSTHVSTARPLAGAGPALEGAVDHQGGQPLTKLTGWLSSAEPRPSRGVEDTPQSFRSEELHPRPFASNEALVTRSASSWLGLLHLKYDSCSASRYDARGLRIRDDCCAIPGAHLPAELTLDGWDFNKVSREMASTAASCAENLVKYRLGIPRASGTAGSVTGGNCSCRVCHELVTGEASQDLLLRLSTLGSPTNDRA